jgi:site-specific DNA recombinase
LRYKAQERKLISVLRRELADPDIVLDELNQMKRECNEDKKRLNMLIETKNGLDKISEMEVDLKELCKKIIRNLDDCKASEKKDAYGYLDLKVKATNNNVDIRGFLDIKLFNDSLNLITTGQTSA